MMVWMYFTPMFYSIDIIPEKFLPVFYWNPMLYVISMYQQILYYKGSPNLMYMWKAILFALFIMIIGSVVFKILEKRFAEEL